MRLFWMIALSLFGGNPSFAGADENTAAAVSLPNLAGSEIAIVLDGGRFYPSSLRILAGVPSTLIFATTNKKAAAIVVEPMGPDRTPASESRRELSLGAVASISFPSQPGRYRFQDVLGTATGTILVE